MRMGYRKCVRRRILSCILAMMLVLAHFSGLSAYGDAVVIPEERRIVLTMGADLSEEQRAYILQYFGIADREVTTIVITNQDERDCLLGKIPEEQIGTHTLSCALVRVTDAGGVQVKTANMNYVTSNTIASTLSTSGVYNCEVLTAAPFEVSGTGALTGVMMAYEAATGLDLDPEKKDLANDELVLTGELADQVGQDEAALVVNDIKIHIVRDQLKEEEEVRGVVDEVVATAEEAVRIAAEAQGFDAPSPLGQVEHEKLYEFGYKYSGMDYNYKDLQRTLERVTHNVTQKAGIDDPIEDTFETLDEDSSLDPDSILLGTADEVLGEDANINATNSAALGDHEAEPIDVFTGEVTLTESGGVKADGFISGTNLVGYKDLNGSYALMDLNGNMMTESVYNGYFSSDSGYIKAQLNDGSGLKGLLETDGSIAVPFDYPVVEILGEKWAAGITLAEGTEADYDYSDYSGGYYVIDHVDVYYRGADGETVAGSLGRDQYYEGRGRGDYLNVQDRTGSVSTCDTGLNVLRTAEGLSDFGEYDEDARLKELIEEKTGGYCGMFLGSYAKLYGSDNGKGVTDRYGNIIIPTQFDDILMGRDSYDGYGYFGASRDGKFVYVTQGGSVTGAFEVASELVDNCGMSASCSAPDGTAYILSGDGVMSEPGVTEDKLSPVRASKGMFWKVQNGAGKYDLLDWHGNVLLTDSDDYSISANGNYLIAQNGYTSSTLYLVNDASPVSITDTAGGASELEVQIEEGASMEQYAGTPVLEKAGEISAGGFAEGTDLVIQKEESGRALADLSGNRCTDAAYSTFWYDDGWLKVTDAEGVKGGLLSLNGVQVLPCEYDKVDVLNENWAVAYSLTPGGTEEDYDFSGSGSYYLISEAKICHLSEEELTSVSLSRDQFADAYAEDDFINIRDRSSGLVTTYDSSFQAVASADSLYRIESGMDVQIRKIEDSTGLSVFDTEFTDGYIRVSDYSRESANEGVADMNGELILPCSYDRVQTYYTGRGSRFWASGYFAVELNGSAGYVSSGGEVTCELKYDAEKFRSCGVAAEIENADGTRMIAAADGTESGNYTYVSELGGSGKFWKVRTSEDSYSYDVIDWHGNVLFEDISDAEVSYDDQYMLIWKDYGDTAELYGIDGAQLPEIAGGTETGTVPETQAPETQAPEAEPAPEEQTQEASAPAENPQEAADEGQQAGSDTVPADGGDAPQAGETDSLKILLSQALSLTESDFDGQKDQILSILKGADQLALQSKPDAASVIGSAVILIEGGAGSADTVTTLINSAIGML